MPVRSLTTSVLRWPSSSDVAQSVQSWAASLAKTSSGIRRVGYRGSLANGGWGVGSDVDLVIIVDSSDNDFFARGRDFDATGLPVPADVLVYTAEEEATLGNALKGIVWVFQRREGHPASD